MVCLLHNRIRTLAIFALLCDVILGHPVISRAVSEEATTQNPQQVRAFQAGESLSYNISWSRMLKAGTAVMEVKAERRQDGQDVLRIIMTSHTVGALDKLYKLGDVVQSVFDPQTMQSLSFSLRETHGKKTRSREVVFDHEHHTAIINLNNDPPETVAIPEQIQDSLTSLYYLRTREDFVAGQPITFDVFDSDKSWIIEVQTLGKEQVKTPAGEFSTIKVRAHHGLFMSEREVFVWLTDDVRKIPVRIKSQLSIGSLVFTLTSLRSGGNP